MAVNRFTQMTVEQLQRRYDVVRGELDDAHREYNSFDYWSDEEYAMRRAEIDEMQDLLDQIESELIERGAFDG